MTKQHRDRDFLEAPRPEEGDVKAFLDSIDKVKISKKAKKKHEEAAANRKREEAQIESRLRKEDVGRGYEIRFNRYDTDSFYNDRCVLPAAAHWNMDEFLMIYIATGVEALLKGPTDWNWSIDGKKPSTRKKLKKIAKLCRKHIEAVRNFKNPEGAGDKALRMIADIGVGHFWD